MITEYIPRGYENRVSRQYLNNVLHITDREIRNEIANSDEIIIHDDGYFIPDGPQDLDHIENYMKREVSRYQSILKRVEKAREMYHRIEAKA